MNLRKFVYCMFYIHWSNWLLSRNILLVLCLVVECQVVDVLDATIHWLKLVR